jgi:hypothetical protein
MIVIEISNQLSYLPKGLIGTTTFHFPWPQAQRAADESFERRQSAGVNPAHRSVVLAMQPGSHGTHLDLKLWP